MTNTRSVKAKFRYVTELQKTFFNTSGCVLGISVGQEAHEGELLDVTLRLINQSFKSCNILVDDTLQRYTMAMLNGGSPEDYRETAIKNGDLWLKRNQERIDKLLQIPTKIFRYNHWLFHPQFSEYKTKIINLLSTHTEFRKVFDATCQKFVDKCSSRQRSNINDMERLKVLSWGYLLEECTTYCLLADLSCQFKVHPVYVIWHES